MPRFSGFLLPRQMLTWGWNLSNAKTELIQDPENQRQYKMYKKAHKMWRWDTEKTEAKDAERKKGNIEDTS